MDTIGQIDRAELYIVMIPLVSKFKTSYGVETHKEALLLRLISGDHSGWGESTTFRDPYYNYETIETSLIISKKYLLPIVLKDPEITIETAGRCFDRIRGHNMSKAMVENALLDLYGRKKGIPLYKVLGGRERKIMSGISIGIPQDVGVLLESIAEAVGKKYHRIKVKIKKGWDVNIVSAIRGSFPNIDLTVDANGAYSQDDIETLRQLDKFELKMIEQPFSPDDLRGHSILQKEIKTPVCLDESISDLSSAVTAINFKSCRIICIKQGRVGGLINARDLKDYCKKNNIGVWSGGMLETGIGRAFNIHMQTLDGFELPGDTSESSRFFDEDIVREPVVLDGDGYIRIPEGNGSGVEVIPGRIEKFMTFREIMKR